MATVYGTPSRSTRAACALTALLIVLASLVGLRAHVTGMRGDQGSAPVSVLMMLPRPVEIAQPVAEAPVTRATQPVAAANARAKSGPVPAATAASPTRSPPTDEGLAIVQNGAVAAPSPERPASAPLDLSAGALRSATANVKGSVRSMADASGRALATSAVSRDEQLAAAVATAKIPFCLHADTKTPTSAGSVSVQGLLAVPVLIYAAATGRCRP